ncbi:class I SAM-dependent methyltransferase [Candidatus Woesearchaeota archaeon]|nr:class I SAM-dependent methyltransferase [Candidatus Woesearchaeota archaeon]
MTDLKKLVVEEFSGKNAQIQYKEDAESGLWRAEELLIGKYFKPKCRILDVGCGTGRTTIHLHKKGYAVIGVDLVPAMIKSAKEIAKEKKLNITYKLGDATKLKFKKDTFDAVLFSFNGWTQIPGKENRLNALNQMCRVLKKGGVLIFTTHRRTIKGMFLFFWMKQWLRFYIFKPLKFPIDEQDYGDRFFERESDGTTSPSKQYIHIPAVKEVIHQICAAKMEICEVISEEKLDPESKHLFFPVFYVAKKL